MQQKLYRLLVTFYPQASAQIQFYDADNNGEFVREGETLPLVESRNIENYKIQAKEASDKLEALVPGFIAALEFKAENETLRAKNETLTSQASELEAQNAELIAALEAL